MVVYPWPETDADDGLWESRLASTTYQNSTALKRALKKDVFVYVNVDTNIKAGV